MRTPFSIQKIACTLCLCVLVVCGLASADSIQLRNGRHLQGKYIGGSSTMIGFMTSHSVEYFQTSDVLALIFDNNTEGNPAVAPDALQPHPPNPMNANPTSANPTSANPMNEETISEGTMSRIGRSG